MKSILLGLAFLSSLSAGAASIPVTVTFNLPSAAYLTDVETSRFQQTNNRPVEGTLTAAITSTSTSISITGLCPANGTGLFIDAEPLLSTAGAGSSSCTVTRNSALAQAGTVAAVHAIGAVVNELTYPSANVYFTHVGVQSFIANVIQSLGTSSAVIGSAAASIATAQASAQAAVVGVVQ